MREILEIQKPVPRGAVQMPVVNRGPIPTQVKGGQKQPVDFVQKAINLAK